MKLRDRVLYIYLSFDGWIKDIDGIKKAWRCFFLALNNKTCWIQCTEKSRKFTSKFLIFTGK